MKNRRVAKRRSAGGEVPERGRKVGTTRTRGGEFRAADCGVRGRGQNGCPERLITLAHGRFWGPGAKWVPREANSHVTRSILGSGEGAKLMPRDANRNGTRQILGSGEGHMGALRG